MQHPIHRASARVSVRVLAEKRGAALSRRPATISVDFDRVEAEAPDRAVKIGVRLYAPFALRWDWTPARSALDKPQAAITAA
jgi:hypothetical protein